MNYRKIFTKKHYESMPAQEAQSITEKAHELVKAFYKGDFQEAADILDVIFYWYTTKQGEDYWGIVYDDLCEERLTKEVLEGVELIRKNFVLEKFTPLTRKDVL